MNPWGLLYECLHSALIDVLNRQFEGVHPELDLPQTTSSWALPADCAGAPCRTHTTRFQLISSSGATGEAMGCLVVQGNLNEILWSEVTNLATAEFGKRVQRQSLLQGISLISDSLSVSTEFPEWKLMRPASRLVWTPVRLESKKTGSVRIFLGLALRS